MVEPIRTVVVGYGLAGRFFHCPLIRRQAGLALSGVVARDPSVRSEAEATLGVHGYASLEEALRDSRVRLIVIATPHDTHATMAIRALEAGKDCVVDKVMALSDLEADQMIAARDRAGRMLSVFHNRRWDWDYLTLTQALAGGRIGQPLQFESSVCRYAPPRSWRGQRRAAGTILHDWGAHLVDQALLLGMGPCRRLSAWLSPAPWPGVETGGHGRITMEFDRVLFQIQISRISRLERPRWWVLGTEGELLKYGIDPQEDALRAGDLDSAAEPDEHRTVLIGASASGARIETPIATYRGSWDAYYANIAEYLAGEAPLAVSAEQGREVVRVLSAAVRSAEGHSQVIGPWGTS
jgi:scyllo-inositol 2-dehydrogenase (NADP+)